jgi:broad specificity phosphatase PhoE
VGVGQCSQLAQEVRNLTVKPEVVVVSPLRRAIHTAQLGFRPDGTGPPFVATELCRERVSSHTCDGRRNLTDIKADFGSFVEFSEIADEVDTMWPKKEDSPNDAASVDCANRALRFLHWLHARPEKTIAVVSHWVFYTHLFRLFNNEQLQSKFGNAEMRSVLTCLPVDFRA